MPILFNSERPTMLFLWKERKKKIVVFGRSWTTKYDVLYYIRSVTQLVQGDKIWNITYLLLYVCYFLWHEWCSLLWCCCCASKKVPQILISEDIGRMKIDTLFHQFVATHRLYRNSCWYTCLCSPPNPDWSYKGVPSFPSIHISVWTDIHYYT